MKPHIYWSKAQRHYRCFGRNGLFMGTGRSPREAYHAFMIANGFRLKEAK